GHGAVGKSGDGDDVAGDALLDRLSLDAAKSQNLRYATLFEQCAVATDRLDLHARPHDAGADAAGDDPPEKGVGFKNGAEHPEGARLDLRLRHMAPHQLEQGREALIARAVRAFAHPAVAARTIKDGEIELVVIRVERGEKIERLVHDL